MRKKRKIDWNMGLSRVDHWLCWGMEHGFMLNWPMWAKRPILHVWNAIACMRYGHDEIEVELYKCPDLHFSKPPRCVHCSTELKVDGKYVREIRK